jgi:hypothetical protein
MRGAIVNREWDGSGSTPCYGFSTFYGASNFDERTENGYKASVTRVRFRQHSEIFRTYPRQHPTLSAIFTLISGQNAAQRREPIPAILDADCT